MKFLIVGDSHTQYFGVTNQLRGLMPSLRGIKAVTKTVSASTISGVGKMDSTLQLGSNIAKWCDDHQPDHLVLNLGQVDVELGIPFRSFVKRAPESSIQWLDYFVETYMEYLSTLSGNSNAIILKGINLPVLCYDQQKAIKYIARIVTERFSDDNNGLEHRTEIMDELTKRYPSDIVRTDLAYRFNDKLSAACKSEGYGYFDINSHLTGPLNGTIDPRFVPSKFDHHIIDSLEVRQMHWQELLDLARERIWSADR